MIKKYLWISVFDNTKMAYNKEHACTPITAFLTIITDLFCTILKAMREVLLLCKQKQCNDG